MDATNQQNLNPTPASEWKGKADFDGSDLPLPSGNVARVRRMSPQAFMSSGVIPDPLSAIIRKAIHNKQGLPPDKMKEMTDDPELLQSAMEMFDRVLAHVAVIPQVSMPPACVTCGEYYNVDDRHKPPTTREGRHAYREGERDPNVLYADVVDMDDKVFIFNWAMGGTRDLEKFRTELEASMGTVSDEQDVPVPAE